MSNCNQEFNAFQNLVQSNPFGKHPQVILMNGAQPSITGTLDLSCLLQRVLLSLTCSSQSNEQRLAAVLDNEYSSETSGCQSDLPASASCLVGWLSSFIRWLDLQVEANIFQSTVHCRWNFSTVGIATEGRLDPCPQYHEIHVSKFGFDLPCSGRNTVFFVENFCWLFLFRGFQRDMQILLWIQNLGLMKLALSWSGSLQNRWLAQILPSIGTQPMVQVRLSPGFNCLSLLCSKQSEHLCSFGDHTCRKNLLH